MWAACILFLSFGRSHATAPASALVRQYKHFDWPRDPLEAAPTELTDAGALAASIAKPIKHRCSPHIQRVFGRVPYDPRALFRRAGWPSDSDVDSK